MNIGANRPSEIHQITVQNGRVPKADTRLARDHKLKAAKKVVLTVKSKSKCLCLSIFTDSR